MCVRWSQFCYLISNEIVFSLEKNEKNFDEGQTFNQVVIVKL